jgi:alcohol dehydrogenase (cytochrome c)
MPARLAPGTENVGAVYAISAETGRTLWKYEQRAGMLSLVATGGGLVFGGDANGKFMAFDEADGKILWQTDLGSPVSGYPISFAVNGKQYVAVSTGSSLVAGSVNRISEFKGSNAANMHVFALP